MPQRSFDARFGLSLLTLLVAPTALLAGCSDEIHNDYHYNYYGDGGADAEAGRPQTNAGRPPVQAGSGGGGGEQDSGGAGAGGEPEGGAGGNDPGIDPRYPDAPVPDSSVADLALDIFGTVGNRYWFGVSDEQREAMNNDGQCCGGPIFDGPIFNGGIYQPGGGDGSANYVDHLWITTAGDAPRTAHYGKVQVRIVGQTSRKPWDSANIPTLNLDADQFVKDQRIAGYEHLRFGNGQMGSIFRERLTYELYRRLDYPAPLAAFAWVQSNVWGPEISIPYTVIERYKRAFCERYADEFGGGCTNMWEFSGDFAAGGGGGPRGGEFPGQFPGQASLFDSPESCQIDTCDNTRVKQLEQKLSEVPRGAGFKAALSEYIDWSAFHRFQCLSYVLGVGDDTIHNNNNVVLVERGDGLFQYLPYSVDISLGHDWYSYTPLFGISVLATGCQADEACWADTMTTCEDVIEEFTALQPRDLLKDVYDELDVNGMLRAGDEGRYQTLDSWFTSRLEALPQELEQFREPPLCQEPQVDCGGYCDYPWLCVDECKPPGPGPIGEAGAAAVDDGAGGMMGVGGAMAAGGGVNVAGSMAVGGGAPIECPPVKEYRIGR